MCIRDRSVGWAIPQRCARACFSMQPSIMLQCNQTYSGKLRFVEGLPSNNTAYDSGKLRSHPEVSGQTGPTFYSNEGSVKKHNQSKVSNIIQVYIDIADQLLPKMVEPTHALAMSQRDNLSFLLGLTHQNARLAAQEVQSPGLVAQNLSSKLANIRGVCVSPSFNWGRTTLQPVHGLPGKATLSHMACKSVLCLATPHIG